MDRRRRQSSAAQAGKSRATAIRTPAVGGTAQRRMIARSRNAQRRWRRRRRIHPPSPGWSGAARSAQTLRASSPDVATLPRYLSGGSRPSAMVCSTTTIDALGNVYGTTLQGASALLTRHCRSRHSAQRRRLSSRQPRGRGQVLLMAAVRRTPTPTTIGGAGMVLRLRSLSRQIRLAIGQPLLERASQRARLRMPRLNPVQSRARMPSQAPQRLSLQQALLRRSHRLRPQLAVGC